MSHRIKWPEARTARVFTRPVVGLSEEIQQRMIARAVKKLGIERQDYSSPLTGDKTNERGSLLNDARANEVVIVSRLDVLARSRAEVKTSVSRDFMFFVSALVRKCQYVLVLNDNLQSGKHIPVISDDKDWDDVMERALNVATKGRTLSSKKASEKASLRWSGEFRGVVAEWTTNPERAKELEDVSRIWRDTKYTNEREAYAAFPEEVRAQIKSLVTARRIFGKRNPNVNNVGRPKKE